MRINLHKRFLITFLSVWVLFGLTRCSTREMPSVEEAPTPLVVITDLYHPHQDPGDNLELIHAYTLPNIELKAVLLDCHQPFLKEVATGVGKGLYEDPNGPRIPGYVNIEQLNYIFHKQVPWGIGPLTPMKTARDRMTDQRYDETDGIELLRKTLELAEKPVNIASFGSARILAVAWNNYPGLMENKIKMIHLSAGTSGNHPTYLEWNVALDTIAFHTLMQSGLPITIYPCASGKPVETQDRFANAFASDTNNTYYLLKDLSFLAKTDNRIRQYSEFVFSREDTTRSLQKLEEEWAGNDEVFNRSQHVWETAIWMQLANQALVTKPSGKVKIIPEREVTPHDSVFKEATVRCSIEVQPSGLFNYKYDENGDFYIYKRDDPNRYEQLMNKAIPEYYLEISSHY